LENHRLGFIQLNGLPHAHILVWLIPEYKITPNKNRLHCAEIPDPALDPELHQIVMSNMVHGPCGSINPIYVSLHGKCKKYPKLFVSETHLGTDSYPLYRRKSPKDDGQVSTITMNVRGSPVTQEIDNRWSFLTTRFCCEP